MTQKWQDLINDGTIQNSRIVGITFQSPTQMQSYASKRGLTYPIYSDTGFVFMNQYAVTDFPLVVVVGKSGVIRMFTFDHRVTFKPDAMERALLN